MRPTAYSRKKQTAKWRSVVAGKNYFDTRRLSFAAVGLLAMAGVSIDAPASAFPHASGNNAANAFAAPLAHGLELAADMAPVAPAGPDQSAKAS
jgi:hypothetical protein